MKKRMRKQRKPREHSLFLKAFRIYLQYVNSGLYFRKEHIIGLENVPADGTPVVVVSNHQNCLNDPLCVCLMLTDRRMNFIARANVFKNPVFNKALRAMGLLPAYRMSHEGFSAINKNRETMDDAGQALTDGETLMLYPEADHQDKRWLGRFKIGYLRIAFEAAEKMNFEQDVMVLPSCNHYSNYFHARTDMLIKFDRPISLKPYYERYKESPRETMMEINQLVRSRILDMMLHVEDLEHYDEIDFLRETGYGFKYATEHGFKPRFLPSRLISDQQFVAKMQTATQEQPEKMEAIYEDTKRLSGGLKELGLRDWLFQRNPGIGALLLRGLGLLLLGIIAYAALTKGLLYATLGIAYRSFHGCMTITELYGKEREVIYIPDKVIMLTVTEIGTKAFKHESSKNVREIYIPKSIMRIGSSAFAKLPSLTDLYYEGSEEEWKELSRLAPLEDVNLHFNEPMPRLEKRKRSKKSKED